MWVPHRYGEMGVLVGSAEVRFTADGGQPLFALGLPMFVLPLDDFLSLREDPITNKKYWRP